MRTTSVQETHKQRYPEQYRRFPRTLSHNEMAFLERALLADPNWPENETVRALTRRIVEADTIVITPRSIVREG